MESNRLLRYFFICFILSQSIWTSWAASFKASVNPDVVEVGAPVRVQYTVDSNDAENLKVGDFKDLEVVAGPYVSSSSSISIINGTAKSQHSKTFTYTVVANKEGVFTIPQATITCAGQQLSSNTPQIHVVKQENSGASSHSSRPTRTESTSANGMEQLTGQNVFVRAIPSKTHLYEQECLLVTYKLYSLADVRRLTDVKAPDFKGFLKQDIKQPQNIQFRSEYYNGKNYGTVVLYQVLLFPQKTGTLKIDPFDFEFMFRVNDVSQVGHGFFARYLNTYRDVPKTLRAPSLTIQVDALPQPQPDNFTNVVGNLKMNATISTNNLAVNSPITLRYVISGSGNMKMIETPSVAFPTDFESYDPKVVNNFKTTNNGVSGSKSIEYLLIPRSAGDFEIPAYEFTYFDLQSKKYVTLKTDEFKVHVSKSTNDNGGTKMSNFTNQDQLKVLGQDIRYIHVDEPNVSNQDDYFFGSGKYWAWILLPFVIAFALFVALRKRMKEEVRDKKFRKATGVAKKRLKLAKKKMDLGEREAFFEEILNAMWNYMSDKLVLPVGELSKDNVVLKLEEKGVEKSEIDAFIGLLNDCEFARYAPSISVDMKSVYDRAVDVILKLQDKL